MLELPEIEDHKDCGRLIPKMFHSNSPVPPLDWCKFLLFVGSMCFNVGPAVVGLHKLFKHEPSRPS